MSGARHALAPLRRATLAVMTAVVLLGLSAQNASLRRIRADTLPESTAYAPEAPAWMNLVTVSLGGFRGLAASLLWVRVSILQEVGRFVELVALSDWITQLDPHADDAWSYHAWNLSYNVSAMLSRPEDRLRWVDAGLELLRDRGLRFNPRSAHLHRELGWLYQHKIGAESDSAHLTYKRALARRLAPLLDAEGAAPTPDSPAAARLAETFRLDAGRMRDLQTRYGALDWRLPEAHALYWADAGLRFTHAREDLLLRRMVYQSLGEALRRGRLISRPDATGDFPEFERAPNPTVIPGTLMFFEHTLEQYPIPSIREPYGRFMLQAIRRLVLDGREGEARELHARLGELIAPETPPPFADILEAAQDPDQEWRWWQD